MYGGVLDTIYRGFVRTRFFLSQTSTVSGRSVMSAVSEVTRICHCSNKNYHHINYDRDGRFRQRIVNNECDGVRHTTRLFRRGQEEELEFLLVCEPSPQLFSGRIPAFHFDHV